MAVAEYVGLHRGRFNSLGMPMERFCFILGHVVTATGLPMPLWLCFSGTIYVLTTDGAAPLPQGALFRVASVGGIRGDCDAKAK